MSDFFDSDIVREEAREMEALQMKAMEMTLAQPLSAETKEEKLEYINVVRSLIEKQQIFYTRLKLSDDPRAVDMCRHIEESARMLYGWWGTGNVTSLMSLMLEKLQEFEEKLHEEGG